MDENLHLPDLAFVKETQSQFYVNRGIYNTIDDWFYQNGFKEIVARRYHIIQFLKNANALIKADREAKHIYFPKGLVPALERYRSKCQQGKVSKKEYLFSLLDN